MVADDERAAEVARHQHGLITRAQARSIGFSRDAILTRRRRNRWVTVEAGVYLVNGAPLTMRARILAVCLAFGGVASHRCAAALKELDGYVLDIIEITIPRGRKVKREGIVFHESTDMHLFVPEIVDGIPTTPITRLAVDLGAVVPFARFDRTIAEVVRRKFVTWPQLLHQLVKHSRRGRNGVGALRALLELRFGDELGDSHLEDVFLRELRRRRLPEPVVQLNVLDRNGRFIARVDCAYPHAGIVMEVDSRTHHDDPAFEADRLKRDRMTVEGWAVQEITRDMLLHDAFSVFRRLERLLEHRAHQPHPTLRFSGGRWPPEN